MGRNCREVFAREQHAALVGGLEAGEHAQKRGLAAAGRAEQREELALMDVEAELVHRGNVAKVLGDAGKPHQRLARSVRPWREAASHLQCGPFRIRPFDADQSSNVQSEFCSSGRVAGCNSGADCATSTL
jgi:hypothetical protein